MSSAPYNCDDKTAESERAASENKANMDAIAQMLGEDNRAAAAGIEIASGGGASSGIEIASGGGLPAAIGPAITEAAENERMNALLHDALNMVENIGPDEGGAAERVPAKKNEVKARPAAERAPPPAAGSNAELRALMSEFDTSEIQLEGIDDAMVEMKSAFNQLQYQINKFRRTQEAMGHRLARLVASSHQNAPNKKPIKASVSKEDDSVFGSTDDGDLFAEEFYDEYPYVPNNVAAEKAFGLNIYGAQTLNNWGGLPKTSLDEKSAPAASPAAKAAPSSVFRPGS